MKGLFAAAVALAVGLVSTGEPSDRPPATAQRLDPAPASTPISPAPPAQNAVLEGYGPWRFGMGLQEVTAIEAHAPYEPVRASMGGVETRSGELGEGVASVSFVFNPRDELYLIQVWYELGNGYDEVLAAFHRAYAYVTERFGPARADTGYPLASGMTAEELIALVPDRFAPTGEELDLEGGDMPEKLRMDIRQLRISPVVSPAGARVVLFFAKLYPTSSYLVNVFHQSTTHAQ